LKEIRDEREEASLRYEKPRGNNNMRRYYLLLFCVIIVFAICPSGATAESLGPKWSISGVTYFSGTSRPAIMLRNQDTGEIVVWYTNGSAITAKRKVRNAPDPSWELKWIGDFNSDGKPEILFRSSISGIVQICYLDKLSIVAQDTIGKWADPWRIAGVGDFNGDGSPDILSRNSKTGELRVSFLKGKQVTGRHGISSLPPLWEIACVKDFNGDGSPDILWKNSVTGQVDIWYMNGQSRVHMGSITTRAPPKRESFCQRKGDARAEISWRYSASPSVLNSTSPPFFKLALVPFSNFIRGPPSPQNAPPIDAI
jgi:hypothetical protein